MQDEAHRLGCVFCLIFKEKLCSYSLKAASVITVIVKVISFISSKGVSHSEFQDLLNNLKKEFRDGSGMRKC
jgi:hypothetical protein